MRFRFNDLIIYILLFIFVAAFPFDLLNVSEVYKGVISIGLRLILIGFYCYILYKNQIKIFGVTNFKNLLFCVPFVLACFSNMIASNIDGFVTKRVIGLDLLMVNIVLTLLIAVSEEIIFRLFIQSQFIYLTTIKRIIYSAGIFALLHLLNLANVSSIGALVAVLIQVVYNFGLGLMLAFVFEFSKSFVGAVLLHFGFNLFNNCLVQYYGFVSSQICFYLTAVVIAIILICYTYLIYRFYFKKLDKYFRN